MYKILGFVIMVCIINACVFMLLPDISPFMLTKDAFNQPWRFLTFQFIHLNQMHLVENLIGLFLVGSIATEINLGFRGFLLAYLASVFIVIPFVLILSTQAPVAGNSTGVYGALSLVLVKIRKLIPATVTLPLFTLFIFPSSIINLLKHNTCLGKHFLGEFYHFAGFVCGAIVPAISIKKPKHILRT